MSRKLHVVLASFAMLVATLVFAPCATAADTQAQISGQITDAVTGGDITHVRVRVFKKVGDEVSFVSSSFNTVYDASGRLIPGAYKVDQPAGNYIIELRAYGYQVAYLSTAGVTNEPMLISVEPSQKLTLNAKLKAEHYVKGKIKLPAGAASAKFFVSLYRKTVGDNGEIWPREVGIATTPAADGSFALPAREGQFTVGVHESGDSLAWGFETYYGDQLMATKADFVSVSNADLLLPRPITPIPGGTISGTATFDPAPTRIWGSVHAYPLGQTNLAGLGEINSDGTYQVTGLAPGSYRLEFKSNNYAKAVSQATIPTPGASVMANATLTQAPPPSTLTGTVLDDLGAPLAGCPISIGSEAEGSTSSAVTDAQGKFSATVGAGTTSMHIFEGGSCKSGMRFWKSPGVLTRAYGQAQSFTVAVSAVHDLGVLTYDRGADVSGTLRTNIGSVPSMFGSWSNPVTLGEQTSGAQIDATNYDGPSGTYSFVGVPAGSYRLEFNRVSGPSKYVAGWKGVDGTVVEGEATSQVATYQIGNGAALNLSASQVREGRTISGKIMRSNGLPMTAVTMLAVPVNPQFTTRSAKPAANGNFVIEGLANIDYKIVSATGEGWRYVIADGGPTSINAAQARLANTTSGNIVLKTLYYGDTVAKPITLPGVQPTPSQPPVVRPPVVQPPVVAAPIALPLAPGAPFITGKLKVKKVVTVNAGPVPAGASVGYQWLRNGGAIPGAVGASYKLTKKDKKKLLSVRVTYAKAGYLSVVRVSAAKKVR